MILKPFYTETDYEVVLKLLNKMEVSEKDIERVRKRQIKYNLVDCKNAKKVHCPFFRYGRGDCENWLALNDM